MNKLYYSSLNLSKTIFGEILERIVENRVKEIDAKRIKPMQIFYDIIIIINCCNALYIVLLLLVYFRIL